MAQYSKPSQCPAAKQNAVRTTSAAGTFSEPQITMRRYIHSTPHGEQICCSNGPLLRAVEQQNLLLTELVSAVNGLTALLCTRSAP